MIGEVKAVFHREIKGKIKTVTVSRNKAGQYHAAILFVLKDTASHNNGQNLPKVSTEKKTIGIDLGSTHFCISSDGSKFNNPRWLKKHEKNLKIKQQQLSRKKKGSNNKNKSSLKVAKVHLKIANCRSDFHHKLSRRIVNENQVVCAERLAVANMLKNHKLAKAMQQVGWGQFCTMLKYKAEQFGKIYQEVNRFFPSSKTHNTCLYQIDSLPLDIRFWDCPNCGTKHIDRDPNAACNIRDEGLRILNLTSGTGDKAYRQTVRHSNRGRKKSTTTQVLG